MLLRDFTEREKEMAARTYGRQELKLLQQALASGNLSSLTGGGFTSKFQEGFAKLIGVKYAIAMNSCMSALHAAVMCANAGAGSEVICDPEFIFGTQAVLYNNAIPTFVDIDPVTHTMDPDKIEGAITERTKAIIVTHAWGLPAEIDKIVEIGHRHNLLVIEDCAESILATYKDRYVGSWGDVGCFSFQASKQMSLGDGGMATTNNKRFAEMLAQNAGAPTSGSVSYGLHFNYRMNELTAAVGLAQLESLPKVIEGLRVNAEYYDQAVAEYEWLTLQRREGAVHSFYHWIATFIGKEHGISLDDFKDAIGEANIPSISVGYTQMPAYQHPLVKDRLAHAFHCQSYEGDRDRYPAGLCPIAEKSIPRLVLAYLIEPEETARQEAEKLRQVIRQLEKKRR